MQILVGFVALQHLGFLALEMVFWRKPLGRKVFRMSQAMADETAILAMNQGLYNGFLAAGLVWGLLANSPAQSHSIQVFFLGCVVVAGVFGGVTVNRRIMLVQGLPAAIALAWLLAHPVAPLRAFLGLATTSWA